MTPEAQQERDRCARLVERQLEVERDPVVAAMLRRLATEIRSGQDPR